MDIREQCIINTWSVFKDRSGRAVFPGTPHAFAEFRYNRYCFCLKTDRYDDYMEEFSSCRLELEDVDNGRYLVFSTGELSHAFVDVAFGSLLFLDNFERRKDIASNPKIFYDEIAHMLGNSFSDDPVSSKIAELYVFLKLRENGIKAVFGGFEKKSLHDINCGEYVIEVKSTQKHHGWPITTNPDQMKVSIEVADLYLCLVRLEPTDADGENVYSIETLDNLLGEYSDTDSLQKSMPRSNSARNKRFIVQGARILQVTQSFPRPYLEGYGAELTSYTLNLDPDALGAQDFVDFLKQKGDPSRVQEIDSEESASNEEDDAGANEANESTPFPDSDGVDETAPIASPSNEPNPSPKSREGKRTFEDVVNDYNDFKGEMVSDAQLEAEGLKAYEIAEIKNGMPACVGIGFKNASENCEFVRLHKHKYGEALRFVAAKMFREHHDALLKEARKSREERRHTPYGNLKDLAMSVEALGRDAEKTTVFWLGGKDEAERPVVNLKLSAEDIVKFIDALIGIPYRSDSETIARKPQVVFFLNETERSDGHISLAEVEESSDGEKGKSDELVEATDINNGPAISEAVCDCKEVGHDTLAANNEPEATHEVTKDEQLPDGEDEIADVACNDDIDESDEPTGELIDYAEDDSEPLDDKGEDLSYELDERVRLLLENAKSKDSQAFRELVALCKDRHILHEDERLIHPKTTMPRVMERLQQFGIAPDKYYERSHLMDTYYTGKGLVCKTYGLDRVRRIDELRERLNRKRRNLRKPVYHREPKD